MLPGLTTELLHKHADFVMCLRNLRKQSKTIEGSDSSIFDTTNSLITYWKNRSMKEAAEKNAKAATASPKAATATASPKATVDDARKPHAKAKKNPQDELPTANNQQPKSPRSDNVARYVPKKIDSKNVDHLRSLMTGEWPTVMWTPALDTPL